LGIELGIKGSDLNSDESIVTFGSRSLLEDTKQDIKLIGDKLNSVEEKVEFCLGISNNFLNNKNNYNEP